MNFCKIVRSVIDLFGIVSVAIIILMYFPGVYGKIAAIAWAVLYSLVFALNMKDKNCSVDDFS